MAATSRLIVVARNDRLPRFVMCAACEGYGHDWATSNNPSERPFKVVCTVCGGEGGIPRDTSSTLASGAAAVLRHTHDVTQAPHCDPSPVSSADATGHPAVEFLTVFAGMMLFSVLAAVCLALA